MNNLFDAYARFSRGDESTEQEVESRKTKSRREGGDEYRAADRGMEKVLKAAGELPTANMANQYCFTEIGVVVSSSSSVSVASPPLPPLPPQTLPPIKLCSTTPISSLHGDTNLLPT